MIIKLNQSNPSIDELIHTWIPDSIYDGARITSIDDNYFYLDNFTYMDLTVYRYVTGTPVATPNKKLHTDEYLPIFEDDYIWYTFPHKLWSWDDKEIIEKTYGCLRMCHSYLGDYEGLSLHLYDGGRSLNRYEYFKKV